MNKISNFRKEYFFLSNFCPSPIFLGDKEYKTVEHFYQAGKADNTNEHEIVRLAETPGRAKRLGRKITIRKDWNEIKLQFMKLGLILKFDDDEFGELLLNTGDAILEEGNTWGDRYWGTVDGIGENHIGKLLMEVRQEIPWRKSRRVTTNAERVVDTLSIDAERV